MIWTHTGYDWRTVELWNSQNGRTAFVVCNGPSFAGVNVGALCGPGRVVVGVNNVYPRLRPDIWVGMDRPDCYDQRLWYEAFPKVIRGGLQDEKWPVRQNLWFADCADNADFWQIKEALCIQFWNDSFRAAIQFAMYLGCKHFYFIGVDLSHAKGDYADGNYLTKKQRLSNTQLHEQCLAFMKVFVRKSDTYGITCECASASSKLAEIMPAIAVSKAIEKCEKSLPSGRLKMHVSGAKSRK